PGRIVATLTSAPQACLVEIAQVDPADPLKRPPAPAPFAKPRLDRAKAAIDGGPRVGVAEGALNSSEAS
ncbi:hypothetical protein, partial [Sphingomonas sp. Ant20]|uniref:hypothetical protein n=1 Tax=Sphingomonas sp. Ant20 TaxID=104605 RepID=UPI0005391347